MRSEIIREDVVRCGGVEGVRGAAAHGASRTSGFSSVLRAEILKGHRAAPRKIALMAPLPFCILGALASGVLGGGGAGGTGFGTYGWNYWYVLFLPVSVALISASLANQEARHGFRSVAGLPMGARGVWRAKMVYALVLALAANLVMLAFSVVCARLGGTAPGLVQSGLTAALVTIGCAWMIPVGLALTAVAGTLAGIVVPLLVQVAVGLVFSASGIWWAVPMAATFRLPAPVIGVAPSGIPLLPGDPMAAFDGFWFVSLLLTAASALALACLCSAWLSRKEAR